MTTFTITTAQNFDVLASKAGEDTYNLDGGTLTIDTDTRYCANSSATTGALGDITVSQTLGGSVLIDGTKVRLIPYNTGSGNVPAIGTTITEGGVTSYLLGVWSALNAAPTAVGAPLPASGYIKVKNKSGGNYSAGALSGIGATATGADTVGWIEVIGVETHTCSLPRLGSFTVTGDWWDAGMTSGAANQTIQLPASLDNTYYAGVWIETAPGSDVYEFWPTPGANTDIATDVRGRFVWISSHGLLRIGNNGTSAAGRVPASGCKILTPNILFINTNSSVGFGANAVPNTNPGARYDFTTTNGGSINISKANMAWYLSCTFAYNVTLSDFATQDTIYFRQISTRLSLIRVGVGGTNGFDWARPSAIYIYRCANGGDIIDSALTLTNGYGSPIVNFEDSKNFAIANTLFAFSLNCTATGCWGLLFTRCSDITVEGMKMIGYGAAAFLATDRVSFKNTSYASIVSGNTASYPGGFCFQYQSKSSDGMFDGVDFFGLANVHPYHSILGTGGNSNPNYSDLVLRNVGLRTTPLSCGTVNVMQNVFSPISGSLLNNIKIQRVYMGPTRYGAGVLEQWWADINDANVTIENSGIADYSAPSHIYGFDCIGKGVAGGITMQPLYAQYGTHFFDAFHSATTGRISVVMQEKSAQEPSASSYQILAGAPKFTGFSTLSMPAIGDSIQWEMQYYALGHTGFANADLTMYNGTLTNYLIQYQLDKNDGAGFGALKTLTGASLSAETGIDAALGIKLRIRLTTTVTNSEAFGYIYVQTASTDAAQDYQYPLDTATVAVNGLATGSRVKATKVSNGSLLYAGVESGGAVSFQTEYIGAIRIEARKASAPPYYQPWVSQITSISGETVSATALQILN